MESIALILPIDELLPRIPLDGNFVIEAAPGAGKTTRVPSYLMDRLDGEVIVLEPRRLAARLAARRVASERGERVGDSVGYQVRFEDFTGPKTRLRYMTEGVLNRRLASDPTLRGVSTVVLDEFHERQQSAPRVERVAKLPAGRAAIDRRVILERAASSRATASRPARFNPR